MSDLRDASLDLAATLAAPSSGALVLDATIGDAERYELREELGRGGMGVVQLCRDRRIDREVARKSLVPELGGDAQPRFLREALIQARLEHPVFVPVYDVTQSGGGPAFTMRRVRGRSLRAILRDPSTAITPSRLLRSFVELCLAVDYAHSRGVLHRDIKPENVMLGDFGEVYLLDWGIARIVGADAEEPIAATTTGTAAGAMLGTLGYMSPEQMRGEHGAVDRRSDVYSLGAVLYEILVREPMHVGASVGELIASTLEPRAHRPSSRRGDVPPELDDLVAEATAFDRSSRVPDARALAARVESYLDGVRDAHARKERARVLASEARVLLETTHDVDARIRAGRGASRALALDPENVEARETLVATLVVPEGQEPERAREAAEAVRVRSEVDTAREFGRTLVAFAPISTVFIALSGVRDWTNAAGFVLLTALAGLILASVRAERRPELQIVVGFFALSVANAFGTRWLSPWIVVPTAMLGNTLILSLHASAAQRSRLLVLALLVLVVPALLDELHWVSPSYEVLDDTMVIHAGLAGIHSWLLFGYTVLMMVTGGRVLLRTLDQSRRAEVRLQAVAWTMREVATPTGGE